MMSADIFVSHVADHAGIPGERAERVTRIVLAGLGFYLTPPTRLWIAEELPASLAHMLEEASGAAAQLEQRVLAAGDVTAGRARELIASVCRVVAETLSADAVTALRAAVPASFAALLVAPSQGLMERPPAPRRNATLATGRPGSAHPISEAAPPGMTQERRQDTVADGQPGRDHPLSGARRG